MKKTHCFYTTGVQCLLWLALVFALTPESYSQFVAFWDHAPGTNEAQTAPTTTVGNVPRIAGSTNVVLLNIANGEPTPVTMVISNVYPISFPPIVTLADVPAPGTPLYSTFYYVTNVPGLGSRTNSYVYFGTALSVPLMATVTSTGWISYTFTGLNPTNVYSFKGGAVRGMPTYTNRWTQVEIIGADAYAPNHTAGVVTSAQVPGNLTENQVAVWFGDNRRGDMVDYEGIKPGVDGTFTVICKQYRGALPNGWPTDGVYACALNGIRFEEMPGPQQITRWDVSDDFSKTSNPAGVWSYGWKSNFTGNLTLYTYFKSVLDPVSPPGAYQDIWARFSDDASQVEHNGSTVTARSGDGGVYPPGTTLMYPGTNGRDDNYAAFRFTAPSAGEYLISSRVENGIAGPNSGDNDFYVLHNGEKLFGADLAAAYGSELNKAGYTNTVHLAAGDTIEFLEGRGPDGIFARSFIKIWATIELASPALTLPVITQQPTNQIVRSGELVVFNVQATGSEPLHYQWRWNGHNITNSATASLTLPNVQFAQEGNYSVVVSNAAGSVTSTNAVLIVDRPPVAVAGSDQTVECAAGMGSVRLDASSSYDPDNDALEFAWSLGNQLLGSTPTLDVSLPLGIHRISLRVRDPLGASSEAAMNVTVLDTTAPQIVCPTNIAVLFTDQQGTEVTYSFSASDSCSALTTACDPPSGSRFQPGETQVRCTAVDTASNSASCTFTVRVMGPRSVVEAVRADLTKLAPQLNERDDLRGAKQGIDSLTDALALGVWLDECHLDAKLGGRAFNDIKQAIHEIKTMENIQPDLISRLVWACRTVAEIKIHESAISGTNVKQIAQSDEEILKGDQAIAERKFAEGIDQYRDAWLHAQHLRLKLVPEPKGGQRLEFTGKPCKKYQVQSSSNLVDWTTVGECTSQPDGTASFGSSETPKGALFYRVVDF